MRDWFCNAAMVSRSGGGSAIAKAAYERRTILKDYQDGSIKNYTYKDGLFFENIMTPENAPEEWKYSSEKLWNAVAQKENESKHWRTAQEARRLIFELPHELGIEDNREVITEIGKYLASEGMCVDIVGHLPDPIYNEQGKIIGHNKNYHAHALLTTREVNENGFGNKNRKWNDREYYHNVIEKNIVEIINKRLSPENQFVYVPYDKTKQSYKGYVYDDEEKEYKYKSRRKPMIQMQKKRRLEKAKNEMDIRGNNLVRYKEYLKTEREKKRKPSTVVGSKNQKQTVPQPEPLHAKPVKEPLVAKKKEIDLPLEKMYIINNFKTKLGGEGKMTFTQISKVTAGEIFNEKQRAKLPEDEARKMNESNDQSQLKRLWYSIGYYQGLDSEWNKVIDLNKQMNAVTFRDYSPDFQEGYKKLRNENHQQQLILGNPKNDDPTKPREYFEGKKIAADFMDKLYCLAIDNMAISEREHKAKIKDRQDSRSDGYGGR